jgi:hypothetical protein
MLEPEYVHPRRAIGCTVQHRRAPPMLLGGCAADGRRGVRLSETSSETGMPRYPISVHFRRAMMSRVRRTTETQRRSSAGKSGPAVATT